ncbi:hypothetical protein PXC01_17330 [Maribacter sp. M208]|uniref:hypothetical protein n=1 Tax=Maribacter huludaoensis TaxID=3030010 RepID=UPI0023ED5199|nr:hypothetical protein [Maribacter huludaoensis]MDF4223371.1 hypothetical protein [Maribacter huludaoensis]
MNYKYWITIVFLLILSNVNSQKCKESTDPFTNEKTVEFQFKERLVFFELKDNVVRFEFEFNFSGERDFIFDKGTSIYFKFASGKTLEIKSDRDCQPTIENARRATSAPGGFTFPDKNFTSYFLTFKLTKEELDILSNEVITYIRTPHVNGGHEDKEAKGWVKKKAKAIKQGAECIISHL